MNPLWLQILFYPELDANEASFQLQKHGFPPAKWKDLANGLKQATAASTIQADAPDVSARLQALIVHWLASDPEATWQKLVDAVRMCKENVIAANLAKDVGAS